MFIPSK